MATHQTGRSSRDHDRKPTSQQVPWWGETLLGLFLLAIGFVLLYSVVVLWPAVQAATTRTATTGAQRTVSWFGFSYRPAPEAALLVLVVLVSALGSFLHAAVSFSDYVGNRRLARSWIWWYLLRVLVGTSLAVLFYFAIRGGFFSATTSSNDINPYGIAALAGLVGLFSKQATDKLREIFDTAFRVAPGRGDDARGNSITNPVPVLLSAAPQKLSAGEAGITLVGNGFTPSSIVRVAREDGAALPRQVECKGPQELAVTLEAEDVAAAGTLRFSVVNSPPGGGTSAPLRVDVEDLEAGVQEAP